MRMAKEDNVSEERGVCGNSRAASLLKTFKGKEI
ncbi:MAG: hypothetical protein JWP91_511 [Fibrobacteres bacterium]|nr:hypothetical protein [Fibrobacterota bacterium]